MPQLGIEHIRATIRPKHYYSSTTTYKILFLYHIMHMLVYVPQNNTKTKLVILFCGQSINIQCMFSTSRFKIGEAHIAPNVLTDWCRKINEIPLNSKIKFLNKKIILRKISFCWYVLIVQ